jgi:hypothetical protein
MAKTNIQNKLVFQNRRTAIFTYLAIILVGTLSVETIRLPFISIYIAPLTGLLATAVLPFYYSKTRRITTSPLFLAVTVFVVYALVHSIIFLGVDLLTLGMGWNRVFRWIEEVIALGIGVSVFYVLRHALTRISDYDIGRIGVIGAVPALAIASLTILWMVAGLEVFAVLPKAARTLIAPTGFDGLGRTTGFSSEPSHFAFFLVTIVIPLTIIGYHRVSNISGFISFEIKVFAAGYSGTYTATRLQLLWIGAFLVTLVVLVGTFSVSGVLILVIFCGLLLILSGRWHLTLVSILCLAAFSVVVIIFFPDTYLGYQMGRLLTGNWGTSILTRYYSTIGPLITAFQSLHGFLGYGLGGMKAHFSQILFPEALHGFKQADPGVGLNLKTLVGRIIAETGVPGATLFAVIIAVAYTEVARCHGFRLNPVKWSFKNRVVVAGLLAAVFGHGIAMGSFAIPYLWFWLAFIDAEYLVFSSQQEESSSPTSRLRRKI